MVDIRGYLAGSTNKTKIKTSRSRKQVISSDEEPEAAAVKQETNDKSTQIAATESINAADYFGVQSARKSNRSRTSAKSISPGLPDEDPEQPRNGDLAERPDNIVSESAKNSTRKHVTSKGSQSAITGSPMSKPIGEVTTKSIIDAIPLVEVPESVGSVTFSYQNQAAPVKAPGSKTIPDGADDCLSGLSFVLTGVLDSLERYEAQDLIKRYGGRVLTAPSRNTSFVVIGDQAGPSKIKKIRDLGIKTIDENGLLQLISTMPAAGGGTVSAQKAIEKRAAEEKKAKENAMLMAKEEAIAQKSAQVTTDKLIRDGQQARVFTIEDQLWTTRYAPRSMRDVIGNKANVEKLAKFLSDWSKNLKAKFKKPGPEGLGLFRAVLISGPPGIGKTTSAHLAANLADFDILEFNASDTRSKKLLENGLASVVDNASLRGYFGHAGESLNKGRRRIVLIMDEVDGMSAGDRGGVGALNAVIRKSRIPIVCICNDRSSQKLKPLDKTTFDLRFTKPSKDQIRSRIMSIAYKERLSISPTAIDQLVDGTGSDIRQIINLLSTYRLTSSDMNQDQGRKGAQDAAKHVILKPWDIVAKLLNGAIYNERSSTTLNQKIELYFNDHELSYLMIQENYLATTPDKARIAMPEIQKRLLRLQLSDRAANAISDGDLVDSMIHGQQQHWSLMPIHAVFSCVRPAFHIAGASGRTSFTSVLGNMSRLSKANRQLRELRAHLRLRISADRHEVRSDYIPILFAKLPATLASEGSDYIPKLIEVMDQYYITREDYDNLLDLGIGRNQRSTIDASVNTATKTAFTRMYNKLIHPTAFVSAAETTATSKKGANASLPDIEDAVDISDDEGDALTKPEEEDDDIDLKKDKLISAPKRKAKTSLSTKPSKRTRTT